MRDRLPKRIGTRECGIVNLDGFRNKGTHWTAFIKDGPTVFYFDSFGSLIPPKELIRYLHSGPEKNVDIMYNSTRFQNLNDINCGHLCLKFLYSNTK